MIPKVPRGAIRYLLLALALIASFVIFLWPFASHVGREKVFGASGKSKGGSLGAGGRFGEEDEAMREWEYRRALQYEGTGARVQAFLEKARSGQPFTVSAIGGSVSKGRGLVPSEQSTAKLGAMTLYSPENVHMLIFQWLNETFPIPGNRFVNGAQGGVGAGYFGWCFKEHIPEDSDLVLVELGINDLLEIEVIDAYENVIRGILELDTRPAVINVETFSTLFPTLLSSSSLHQDVAAFYDVPSLSVRDVILPRILADPHVQLPRWFRTVREWGGVPVDLMHISALGHALAATLVIRYLTEQMERSKSSYRGRGLLGRFTLASSRSSSLQILDLPTAALNMPFDPLRSVVHHNPTCRSMNSGILHLPPSITSDPESQFESVAGLRLNEESRGWATWQWKEKIYLVGRDPGALAAFDFYLQPPVQSIDSEVIEELVPTPQPTLHRFDPVPMGVRPGGPYNIHPIGVVDQRRRNHKSKRVPLMMLGSSRGSTKRQDEVEKREESGRVMIGYQRSATLGLGSVWCWVDDDREGRRKIDGWWDIRERNMGM